MRDYAKVAPQFWTGTTGKAAVTISDSLSARKGPRAPVPDDPVCRFAGLYRGRLDCLGTESGGYLPRRPTFGHFRGHLSGRFGLGIYPLRDDGTVAWAAVDLDQDDLDRALLLRRLLHEAGLPAILLRSRAKGFHITCFFRGWVRATDARRVLRACVLEAGLPPQTELYPRADVPPPGAKAPGGYLRLPYLAARPEPGHPPKVSPAPGHRLALEVPSLRPLSLSEFLNLAEASQVDPDHVRAVAEKLASEEDASPTRDVLTALPDAPARLGVSPEIAALILQGWTPGSKYPSRSEAQLAVTCALLQAGHSEDVVVGVLICPRYGIAERALEQLPQRRADALTRCLAKARARIGTFPASAAGSLTPSLHRRLVALRLLPLAWPVLAEILATTDRATGLSFVTAASMAKRFRVSRATVYRMGLMPLRRAGLVEAVPLDKHPGQWGRTAFRVVAGPRFPSEIEKPSEELRSRARECER